MLLMTPRTPQVGDTIATAEELDALPIKSLVIDQYGLAYQRGTSGKWHPLGGGVAASTLLAGAGPLVLVHDGRPPRPERVVKAEALREYADAIYRDLARTNSSSTGYPLVLSAVSALRARADRIARGDH